MALPGLTEALDAVDADKRVYLYAPISKLRMSAHHLMDILAQRGVGVSKSPPLLISSLQLVLSLPSIHSLGLLTT